MQIAITTYKLHKAIHPDKKNEIAKISGIEYFMRLITICTT